MRRGVIFASAFIVIIETMNTSNPRSSWTLEDVSTQSILVSASPMNKKGRLSIKVHGHHKCTKGDTLVRKYLFIDRIRAHAGDSVASVFEFHSWLIRLNILNSLLIVTLLFLPHQLQTSKPHHDMNLDYNMTCITFKGNMVLEKDADLCCPRLYMNDYHDYWSFFSDLNQNHFCENFARFIQDFIQGSHWLSHSPIFYGYYKSSLVIDVGPISYDFSLSYFIVMIIILLLNLIALAKNSSSFFKPRILESNGYDVSSIIFSQWNHSALLTAPKLNYLKKAFRKELQFRLFRHSIFNYHKTFESKSFILFKGMAINTALLALVILVCFGINILNEDIIPSLMEKHKCQELYSENLFKTDITCFGICILSSVVIQATTRLISYISANLVCVEKYKKRTKFTVQLLRNFVICHGTIFVTYYSYYRAFNCPYFRGCIDLKTGGISDGNCSDSFNLLPVKACSNVGNTFERCEKKMCWENFIGQQLYTISITEFITSLFIFLIKDLPPHLSSSKSEYGSVKFDIHPYILHIMDTQIICWFALFYAPMSILLVSVLNIIEYYIGVYHILKICRPSPFDVSKPVYLMKLLMVISHFNSSMSVGLTLLRIEPSISCGPFRHSKCSAGEPCLISNYIYNSLIEVLRYDFSKKVFISLYDWRSLMTMAGCLLIVLLISIRVTRINRKNFYDANFQVNELKRKRGIQMLT